MTLKEIKLQYWHEGCYGCGRLLPLSFCSLTIKGDSGGVGSGNLGYSRKKWKTYCAAAWPSRSVERVGGWIDDSGMGFGMCLRRKKLLNQHFQSWLVGWLFLTTLLQSSLFIVVFKSVPFETGTVLCFIQFYSICSASIKHCIWVQIREVLKL